MSYPGPPEMYPKALTYFKELRDPEALCHKDRHYVSYLRGRIAREDGARATDPTLRSMKAREESTKKIVLKRSAAPTSDEYEFRAAEDWSTGEKALLKFNAVGLLPQDEIEVTFNGKVIPPTQIERTYHEEERTREEEGMRLPAYTTCAFVPTTPSARFGRNVLALTLLEGGKSATGEIVVPEIEVAVSADDVHPREIMSMIHEPERPQIPVLAGYHPHYSSVWKEKS